MRKIKIVREKGLFDGWLYIILDGATVALVGNGEMIELTTDDNAHEIFAQGDNNAASLVVKIEKGNEKNIILNVDYINGQIQLSPANADCGNKTVLETSDSQAKSVPINFDSKGKVVLVEDRGVSYVSSVVISLILAALCGGVFSVGQTSLLGFIFGLIFSVALGTVMIAGGFWIIILPLPFIALFKYGCVKPNQPIKIKAILVILTFVIFALIFVSLFVIR